MIITFAEAFESIETFGEEIQNIEDAPPGNLLGSGSGPEKSNKTGIGWLLIDKVNFIL